MTDKKHHCDVCRPIHRRPRKPRSPRRTWKRPPPVCPCGCHGGAEKAG